MNPNIRKILLLLTAILVFFALTAALASAAQNIPPKFAAMFGNGPSIKHTVVTYDWETRWDTSVGAQTPVSLYKGTFKATGKPCVMTTFKDKKSAQNFIASGEGMTAVGNKVDEFSVARSVTPLKVTTGIRAYAGTNNRPGIKNMRYNGKLVGNVAGFTLVFYTK